MTICFWAAVVGFVFANVSIVSGGVMTDVEVKIMGIAVVAIILLGLYSWVKAKRRPRFEDNFWRHL